MKLKLKNINVKIDEAIICRKSFNFILLKIMFCFFFLLLEDSFFDFCSEIYIIVSVYIDKYTN